MKMQRIDIDQLLENTASDYKEIEYIPVTRRIDIDLLLENEREVVKKRAVS
jgi:hypothetical protein